MNRTLASKGAVICSALFFINHYCFVHLESQGPLMQDKGARRDVERRGSGCQNFMEVYFFIYLYFMGNLE